MLRVDVVPTDARDPAGNPVPETVLRGSGEALVASQGHAVAATWTKDAAIDPVALTQDDGEPVTLAAGMCGASGLQLNDMDVMPKATVITAAVTPLLGGSAEATTTR